MSPDPDSIAAALTAACFTNIAQTIRETVHSESPANGG
jgi:hypothetical protein